MRIGIQLPEVEREVRWPEYLAMARAAEASGFDSIWVGDHLLYRGTPERGPWEAWTLLGALAAATERVALGPLVACTALPPAGPDREDGGHDRRGQRRALRARRSAPAGTGRSSRAFGLPYDRRVSRFEEAFAIVRGLLAGERVTLAGEHFRADDAVLLPPPARRIPLMIGSNGPRMLSIALPHVDAWNTWYADYGNTAEGFAALVERTGVRNVERSACVLVPPRRRRASAGRRRAAARGRPPARPRCASSPTPAPTRRSSSSTRSPSAPSALSQRRLDLIVSS